MDEVEAGFQKITERIQAGEREVQSLSEQLKAEDAALLGRMIRLATPLVSTIGILMLKRGKQDTKGELYDTAFHRKKMIVLGKTDPAEFRPDASGKKVDDQFCVLSEDGKLNEVMFSFDGFIVDSHVQPITPGEALDRYGYEVLYMLYHALHDYLKGSESLIAALKQTLEFVFPPGEKKK